ncbi:MAG: GNAT family N-acetyltransferase [Pseudomonadota bacterium]
MVMAQITLRPAIMIDLDFVAACAESAYSIYIERIGKKPAPMVADFAVALRERQLEILEVEGKAIGFLISYAQQNSLFIENVAIEPSCQGYGYGSASFALLEARAKAKGLTAIELYTNEKMTENLAFYPRLGFVEFDRRKEEGFNRVYFRKTLD